MNNGLIKKVLFWWSKNYNSCTLFFSSQFHYIRREEKKFSKKVVPFPSTSFNKSKEKDGEHLVT